MPRRSAVRPKKKRCSIQGSSREGSVKSLHRWQSEGPAPIRRSSGLQCHVVTNASTKAGMALARSPRHPAWRSPMQRVWGSKAMKVWQSAEKMERRKSSWSVRMPSASGGDVWTLETTTQRLPWTCLSQVLRVAPHLAAMVRGSLTESDRSRKTTSRTSAKGARSVKGWRIIGKAIYLHQGDSVRMPVGRCSGGAVRKLAQRTAERMHG